MGKKENIDKNIDKNVSYDTYIKIVSSLIDLSPNEVQDVIDHVLISKIQHIPKLCLDHQDEVMK